MSRRSAAAIALTTWLSVPAAAAASVVRVAVPGVVGPYQLGQTRVGNFDLGVEFTSLERIVLRLSVEDRRDGYCTNTIPPDCEAGTAFNILIREPWTEGDPAPVFGSINLTAVSGPLLETKAELSFTSAPIPVEKTCYGYRWVLDPKPLDVIGDGKGALALQLAYATGTITSAEIEVEGTVAPEPAPDADADGIADADDNCVHAWNPDQHDADGNHCGDACECGDQSGDGRVDVLDILAINLAIFDPARATPLCDTNDDGRCDVLDMIGVMRKISWQAPSPPGHFSGKPAYCSRFPPLE